MGRTVFSPSGHTLRLLFRASEPLGTQCTNHGWVWFPGQKTTLHPFPHRLVSFPCRSCSQEVNCE